MNITRKTVYETCDGKVFFDRKEATRHEQIVLLKKAIRTESKVQRNLKRVISLPHDNSSGIIFQSVQRTIAQRARVINAMLHELKTLESKA